MQQFVQRKMPAAATLEFSCEFQIVQLRKYCREIISLCGMTTEKRHLCSVSMTGASPAGAAANTLGVEIPTRNFRRSYLGCINAECHDRRSL